MIVRSIREMLTDRSLYQIGPDETVRTAARELDRHGVGALAVVDEGRLVGILSERDIVRRAISRNRPCDTTSVRDIMTADPVTVDADTNLSEALEVMLSGGFRHVPVTDGPAAIGMLSLRDIPTGYRLMFERYTARLNTGGDAENEAALDPVSPLR